MQTHPAPKDFRRAPWRFVLFAISLCLISTHAFGQHAAPDPQLRNIKHIVVIYQENWSFDSLYGLFPGADVLANGFGQLAQVDVTASPPYSSLIYQTPSPLTGGATDPQFPSANGKL